MVFKTVRETACAEKFERSGKAISLCEELLISKQCCYDNDYQLAELAILSAPVNLPLDKLLRLSIDIYIMLVVMVD